MDLVAQALACHKAGRLAEADQLYQRILAIAPDTAAILSNRAAALLGLGRAEEAVACCDRALAIEPDCGSALGNLGNAYMALGRPADALTSYQRLLAIDPESASAWNSKGNALRTMGQLGQAEESYTCAITLRPRWALALTNRSRLRLERADAAGALPDIDRALAIEPEAADGHTHRAAVLFRLERWKAAAQACDAALSLTPRSATALAQKGDVLLRTNDPAEALRHYDMALREAPTHGPALGNRAVALQRLGRHEEALAACEVALARDDEGASQVSCNTHFCEAWCRLVTGDFARGWPNYEWRWRLGTIAPLPAAAGPLWRGQSLVGKTILLLAEQGLGDTLQFVRFLPHLQSLGASVVLAVQPTLRSLMPADGPTLRVISNDQDLPPHDWACPLLSLPLALGVDIDSIPAEIPYLTAKQEWLTAWTKRLGPRTRPRVGVAWAGSPTNTNDANRSIPLARFARLFSDDCDFISLHPDIRIADETAFAACLALRDVRTGLTDFAATAGLIAGLDLIVTVDTAVAHLAGALGKPVWILLPFAPEWRWLTDRCDSPWYPTARLWRQTTLGDWDGLLAEVADGLRIWAQGRVVSSGRLSATAPSSVLTS